MSIFLRTRIVLPVRIAPGSWASIRLEHATWSAHVVLIRVSRAALYIVVRCIHRNTPNQFRFCHLVSCIATVVYSIPSAGMHRRSGEQVSGTSRLCDPVREGRIRFLGSALRNCSPLPPRVVLQPELRIVSANIVFFDPSSPTSLSTTSPLRWAR